MAAKCKGHVTLVVDGLTFCSDFDNGNLRSVEESGRSGFDFQVWTAPDNCGTQYESGHSSWFYYSVTGLPKNSTIKFRMMNTKKHGGLYRSDMRPVYRSNSTQNKWMRIRKSVRCDEDGHLCFEHSMDFENDVVFFAFTYPYSYAQLQSELEQMEETHVNTLDVPGSVYLTRELITTSIDQRRIDLLTITAAGGHLQEQEAVIPGLFPSHGIGSAANSTSGKLGGAGRPLLFPGKEVIIVSARVHPGEVPAQHTMRGVLDLLLDPNDPRSRALRERFVFKIIPMLNPDGVFRGHFRMDQLGQNLNRFYTDPDKLKQPSIYALRKLLDVHAANETLAMYLDLHAHASKKGCFIYGNVVDTFEDQVQNQLFCRLIALNSPHFDYEACLFSKDHMTRTDPGDGMTAEGSSRVCTYLAHRLVHSYTLECNYNTGRIGNEVVLPDGDLGASTATPAYRSCEFTNNPEKYTPISWENVGQGCMIAMLDIRGLNPCSRIPKTKFRTLDRIRLLAVTDVRQLSEYRGCTVPETLRRDNLAANMSRLPVEKSKLKPSRGSSGKENNPTAAARLLSAELMWRRICPLPGESSTGTVVISSGRRSSSASADTTNAVAAPRLPRQPPGSQPLASASEKSSPRGILEKANSRVKVVIREDEFSKSATTSVTPDKDGKGPRPTRRSKKLPITVTELKQQLHQKLSTAASNKDQVSFAHDDNEVAKMVSMASRGEISSLTDAITDSGRMHPPPRPLTLMLKGKGGSGISHINGHHSHIPNTHLLMQRHSRQDFRRNSGTSRDSSEGEYENTSINSGDLDAQTELYEDNINTSALLAADDFSDAPAHRVYPLRASKKDALIGESVAVGDNVKERLVVVSASPCKIVDKASVSYDVSMGREKATNQIAKLMGRDISNSPTPSV